MALACPHAEKHKNSNAAPPFLILLHHCSHTDLPASYSRQGKVWLAPKLHNLQYQGCCAAHCNFDLKKPCPVWAPEFTAAQMCRRDLSQLKLLSSLTVFSEALRVSAELTVPQTLHLHLLWNLRTHIGVRRLNRLKYAGNLSCGRIHLSCAFCAQSSCAEVRAISLQVT